MTEIISASVILACFLYIMRMLLQDMCEGEIVIVAFFRYKFIIGWVVMDVFNSIDCALWG